MRFSILAFAALAVAFTAVSATESEDLADELIETFSGGSDPFGDDDYVPPVRRSKKHHHKAGRSSSAHVTNKPTDGARLLASNAKITWYASNDLKNPQCGDGSWNPDNGSHIGAVMTGWTAGGALDCGKFAQLCNEDVSPHRCVKVRIVDKCAGCKERHVDVTKSAFRQLAKSHSLDEGVVDNLKLYQNNKPSPWNLDLFGPLKLKN